GLLRFKHPSLRKEWLPSTRNQEGGTPMLAPCNLVYPQAEELGAVGDRVRPLLFRAVSGEGGNRRPVRGRQAGSTFERILPADVRRSGANDLVRAQRLNRNVWGWDHLKLKVRTEQRVVRIL